MRVVSLPYWQECDRQVALLTVLFKATEWVNCREIGHCSRFDHGIGAIHSRSAIKVGKPFAIL